MTTTYDAINDLKCALCTQWDGGPACAGAKPTIDFVWDKKLVGFGCDTTERIIIQPLKEDIKIFDLFGHAYWHDVPVKIDIRSYNGGITRQNVIVTEVIRIIKNIIRRNVQGFIQVVIKGSETRNQDFRNMFRHIVTLQYEDVDTVAFV
jgi:hypothetical protein